MMKGNGKKCTQIKASKLDTQTNEKWAVFRKFNSHIIIKCNCEKEEVHRNMYRMCRLLVQIKCTAVKDVSIQWNLHDFSTLLNLLCRYHVHLINQHGQFYCRFYLVYRFILVALFMATFGFVVIVPSICRLLFNSKDFAMIVYDFIELSPAALCFSFRFSYCNRLYCGALIHATHKPYNYYIFLSCAAGSPNWARTSEIFTIINALFSDFTVETVVGLLVIADVATVTASHIIAITHYFIVYQRQLLCFFNQCGMFWIWIFFTAKKIKPYRNADATL